MALTEYIRKPTERVLPDTWAQARAIIDVVLKNTDSEFKKIKICLDEFDQSSVAVSDTDGYIQIGDTLIQWGLKTSSDSADVEITTLPYDDGAQRYCFGMFAEETPFPGFITLIGKPTTEV